MPSTLDGINILDLSTGPAAALCTMLLSDQGARVIRIAEPDAPAFRDGGFVIWDRGKERLSLDLDQASGDTAAATRFRSLVAGADVLVARFAPATGPLPRGGPRNLERG
ncbi:MAG: CoA transferase [Alphaproteobacteria bacterium]|nr:CoA transferase [Alphaproteobacteria bacterium]